MEVQSAAVGANASVNNAVCAELLRAVLCVGRACRHEINVTNQLRCKGWHSSAQKWERRGGAGLCVGTGEGWSPRPLSSCHQKRDGETWVQVAEMRRNEMEKCFTGWHMMLDMMVALDGHLGWEREDFLS